MKRPIRPEELRLWSMVAATTHPRPGRSVAPRPTEPEPIPLAAKGGPPPPPAKRVKPTPGPAPVAPRAPAPAPWQPGDIEPRRKHRISRERDPIGARIDLHGMDQDRARVALEGFLRRAWSEDYRAVLVITGKGARGDGVLRRYTPEWLASPALRDVVAGVSEAHRKHGGSGALYVALKRRPRG